MLDFSDRTRTGISKLISTCIACCLITGRRPDRTSWVAPGVRVMHGHRGGLTTIGVGAGVAVGGDVEDDSPRSHSLRIRLGFSLPPLTMCLVCLLYTSPSPRDRQKSRMPSSA